MLDGDGRFWHAGELVTHPGMQEAFASWISRHPGDGRHILCNGYDWTYFTVEDVPFFVRALGGRAAEPTVILSDQTEEPLDPGSLRVGRGDALYCRVKGGAYEARFTPAAQLALAPYVEEGPDEQPVLRLAGREFVVPAGPDSPAPGPKERGPVRQG